MTAPLAIDLFAKLGDVDVLRFGSVCSGIEAASVAWLPLGWQSQFMSEIEAFPRAVLQHHYPEVPLHGDFTTIQAGQYGPIDVLVGGTPCQSFSVAGLRGGMADARGNLALEYLRLADRLRPRWLVWENVPGVRSSNAGRDFGAFLGGLGELGYGWAYRSLDAQYFGLAQRRERVFVVGCLGDWRRAAAVLFDPASLRGDPPPGRKAGAGAAVGTLGGTSPGSGWRIGCDEAAAGQLIASALRSRDGARGVDSDCTDTLVCAIQEREVRGNSADLPNGLGVRTDGLAYTLEARSVPQAVAYGGNNCAGPIEVATAVNAHGRLDFESETFITHALRADGFDASEDGTGRGTPLVTVGFQSSQSGVRSVDTHATLDANNGSRRHNGALIGSAVRRLTPGECEKLQGFPPGYTDVPYRGKQAADGPRYKALGNSMAVPVMAWIGRRIAYEAAA